MFLENRSQPGEQQFPILAWTTSNRKLMSTSPMNHHMWIIHINHPFPGGSPRCGHHLWDSYDGAVQGCKKLTWATGKKPGRILYMSHSGRLMTGCSFSETPHPHNWAVFHLLNTPNNQSFFLGTFWKWPFWDGEWKRDLYNWVGISSPISKEISNRTHGLRTLKNPVSTLPETNIAPENGPSQKETSIPTIHFQVRTVSFREGNSSVSQLTETGSPLGFGPIQFLMDYIKSTNHQTNVSGSRYIPLIYFAFWAIICHKNPPKKGTRIKQPLETPYHGLWNNPHKTR